MMGGTGQVPPKPMIRFEFASPKQNNLKLRLVILEKIARALKNPTDTSHPPPVGPVVKATPQNT